MQQVGITVGELLDRAELGVKAVAGREGLTRRVTVPRIQKPGLALTGWPEQLHDGRVLVLGGTEVDYLEDHEQGRTVGIATMMASDPACLVVCRDRVPPPELVAAAEERGVTLLVSSLVTSDFISAVTAWMADRLAPSTEVHGVLLDVLGMGVLVIGKSGIGKSETALDLVVRGHRLVADDVIRLRRQGAGVVGRSAGVLGHHMEIRGIGIINVKDLFGIAAVRETKKIELVIELREWSAEEEYDRLGFDDRTDDLLGVPVPALRLPVRPGRNLATLVEVAARNQLLKIQGTHSARAFRDQLDRAMEVQQRGAKERGGTDAGVDAEQPMQIVIVTGLSGAGKSTALRALEDIEFTCVDNIPVPLVSQLVEHLAQEGRDKLAIAIDSRQRRNLGAWHGALAKLRGAGHRLEVMFLDATDEVLLRRFSETRRRHPLSGDDLTDGVRRDREVTADLRHGAAVVDTSNLNMHQLKAIIQDRYGGTGKLAVSLVSFGFKHGLPLEFNLVFDVRFLQNPYFEPTLTHLDGRDPEVAKFVLGGGDELVQKVEGLLRFTLPHFQREGKLYVTICVGCTGGRHRSVAIVEELRRRLGGEWDILVRHRDVERGARERG